MQLTDRTENDPLIYQPQIDVKTNQALIRFRPQSSSSLVPNDGKSNKAELCRMKSV